MDYAVARRNMVDTQIIPNRVTDRAVIDAMAEMPREAFVPANFKSVAYVDRAIPLNGDRWIIEPMVVARLLQAAAIQPSDVVLSIGCGTGYAVAVMAKLASTVVAVECEKGFVQKSSDAFTALGIDNVAIINGALTDGVAEQAPYDVIFFDGAVAEIPQRIVDQLADGGRLVAMTVESIGPGGVGQGVLIQRFGGSVARREIFEAGAPLLPGFEADVSFRF